MIRLYSPRPSMCEEPDRVYLSTGVCRPLSGDDSGPSYRASAWVPAGPWRPPSPEERRNLWLARWPDDCAAVGLVDLAGVEPLRLIHEQCCVFDRVYANAVDAAARELLREARSVCTVEDEPILTGVAEHPPGLMTLTVDSGTGKRTGLHVDTWEPRSLEERSLAAGRLCVNVGRVDRWFLFVPSTLQEIAVRLGEVGIATANFDVNQLADAYLRTFPETPVVRARLRPGEAYVAPTDNVIHDGSSLDTCRNNLCYTYRGHFGFRGVYPETGEGEGARAVVPRNNG